MNKWKISDLLKNYRKKNYTKLYICSCWMESLVSRHGSKKFIVLNSGLTHIIVHFLDWTQGKWIRLLRQEKRKISTKVKLAQKSKMCNETKKPTISIFEKSNPALIISRRSITRFSLLKILGSCINLAYKKNICKQEHKKLQKCSTPVHLKEEIRE